MNLHPLAGDFVPDDTALPDCDDDARCFERAFGNISFRDGPRKALALFAERIADDPAVEKNCHRIAHAIGSAALARFDGKFPGRSPSALRRASPATTTAFSSAPSSA